MAEKISSKTNDTVLVSRPQERQCINKAGLKVPVPQRLMWN